MKPYDVYIQTAVTGSHSTHKVGQLCQILMAQLSSLKSHDFLSGKSQI